MKVTYFTYFAQEILVYIPTPTLVSMNSLSSLIHCRVLQG